MTASTTHEGEPILAWLARRSESARRSETDFDDAKLEYRRLFSEVWGTFLLVARRRRWRRYRRHLLRG